MVGGAKTTTAATVALYNPNLLNKSMQTYHRHSKGLNNSSASGGNHNTSGFAASTYGAGGGVLGKYQVQLEPSHTSQQSNPLTQQPQ